MADSIYSTETQFAGLVEAATAAAGQENDWIHNGEAQSAIHPSLEAMVEPGQAQPFARPYTRKRKRGTNGDAQTLNGSDPNTDPLSSTTQTPRPALAAIPLFRVPSSGKKHTRPPMSRLFASLQLYPEDFLRLQAAAKTFMLSSDHPERRNCVGQRGKGDSDMVKLKLWTCAQDFLDREGNGDLYFGPNSRQMETEEGGRSVTWPQDSQQIITILLPLLRRMVTNERQRLYALETRKGGEKATPSRAVTQTLVDPLLEGAAGGDEEGPDEAPPISNTIDIFGDQLVSNGLEVLEWYPIYDDQETLSQLLASSGLSKDAFLALFRNIDAHCRKYHSTAHVACNEDCRTRLIDRLAGLPAYSASPIAETWEVPRELFNLILTRLDQIQYWENKDAFKDPESDEARRLIEAARPNRPTRRQKGKVGATTKPTTPSGSTANSALELLICIVRQNKCVVPIFEAPLSSCQSLEALRDQTPEFWGAEEMRRRKLKPIADADIKVWLPDGLVPVTSDGQWMVALLSAQKVEWMGNQIRVLLEV